MRTILAIIVTALVVVTGSYVAGRILLPAMGLIAPGYWTWFWGETWLFAFLLAANLIKEALDD